MNKRILVSQVEQTLPHSLLSTFPAGPSISPELLEEIDLTNVPYEYHDLRLVFSQEMHNPFLHIVPMTAL